jgi:tetratricopeptide (TPR) repeat protein
MALRQDSDLNLSSVSTESWMVRIEAALQRARYGMASDLDQLALDLVTSKGISPDKLRRIGGFLSDQGALDHALKVYLRSLVLDEASVEAWFMIASLYHRKGHFQQAARYYEGALSLKPDQSRIHSNLASALMPLMKIERARYHAGVAVILEPGLSEGYSNGALTLEKTLERQSARAAYTRAIMLNPFFAEARTNRGKLDQESGHFEFAMRDHRRALMLSPGLSEAIHNRATVLSELRQFEASITAFRRAIRIWPDFANAHLGLSMTLLMIGHYLEGWAENEWRFLELQQNGVRAKSALPRLTAEALEGIEGKKVLLFWEQGLGDTLHFCRYAKKLADQGAKVVLNVQQELLPLIASMDSRIEVTAISKDRPDADYHACLMSLPHIFKTCIETIPSEASYLFPSQEVLSDWSARLGSRKCKRVGLVWSGSTVFKNDHNRSIPLSRFRDLLALPLEFHCLQKEIRPEDLEELKHHPEVKIHTQNINNFLDTAGLAAHMDLVISVDTSVAHLAGAIGKPLWLLVAFTPDNRWFLDREDSPWYPSAKIYRQDQNRSYEAAIFQLVKDLKENFALQ